MNDLTNPQSAWPEEPAGGGAGTVAQRCRAAGGLLRATLGELREELGYRRLGKYVLEEVADRLTEEELGWFPAWRLSPRENAEPRKEQELWVFARDGACDARSSTPSRAPITPTSAPS